MYGQQTAILQRLQLHPEITGSKLQVDLNETQRDGLIMKVVDGVMKDFLVAICPTFRILSITQEFAPFSVILIAAFIRGQCGKAGLERPSLHHGARTRREGKRSF